MKDRVDPAPVVPTHSRVSSHPHVTRTSPIRPGPKSVLIELGNKKSKIEFDRTKGCKVQFRKADNSLVDATDYGPAGSTRFINAQVPAGTAGILGEVVVTMLINGTLRSGSYTTPLTP